MSRKPKLKKEERHSSPIIETRKEESRSSPHLPPAVEARASVKSQPNRLPDGQINKLLLMSSMGF